MIRALSVLLLVLAPVAAHAGKCDRQAAKASTAKGAALVTAWGELLACDKTEADAAFGSFAKAADADPDGLHLADAAVSHQFASQAKACVAALLAAGLQDAARLLGDAHQPFAFVDRERQRLFAVHVLAGAHGGHRHQHMPVVDRAAQH